MPLCTVFRQAQTLKLLGVYILLIVQFFFFLFTKGLNFYHQQHHPKDPYLYDDYDYDYGNYENDHQSEGFKLHGTSYHENFEGEDNFNEYDLNYHHKGRTPSPFKPSYPITSKPKKHHHHKSTKNNIYKFKHKAKKPKIPSIRTTIAPLVNLLTTLNPFKGNYIFIQICL